jgi:uncharacterized protein HemX
MSTPGTNPTDPTPVTPPATETFQPAGATATATTEPTSTDQSSTSEGTLGEQQEEREPGFISRHTTTLITLMVAVIVAAAAIAGVALYRHNQDQANTATEAAFSQMLAGQGAAPETVECSGDTCSAVIQGQAYTVLVQEDAKGKQHFGVTNFIGN